MQWEQYGKNFYACLPEDLPIALVARHYSFGGYAADAYYGKKLVYSQWCADENEAKNLLEAWLKDLHEKISQVLTIA